MFCNQCGSEVEPGATFCNNCGAAVENQQDVNSSAQGSYDAQSSSQGSYQQPAGGGYQQPYTTAPKPQDASSMGFAVLCFFFPVVGLVLWLVWKNDYPLKAKSCGKGALIGVILSVVGWIIYAIAIIGLGLISTVGSSYYY